MQLPELVDRAAKSAGSHAELARRLGVPRNHPHLWKAGRPCPLEHVDAMARMLGDDPVRSVYDYAMQRAGKAVASVLAVAGAAVMLAYGRPADAASVAVPSSRPNV